MILGNKSWALVGLLYVGFVSVTIRRALQPQCALRCGWNDIEISLALSRLPI